MLAEIRNVSKTYESDGNKIQVLDNINFKVEDNDFICIVGPSGCGKSTLLRIIVGLDKPTSGEVFFKGEVIAPDNPKVAMVFQNFALFPWLTVKENIELVLDNDSTNRYPWRDTVCPISQYKATDVFFYKIVPRNKAAQLYPSIVTQ